LIILVVLAGSVLTAVYMVRTTPKPEQVERPMPVPLVEVMEVRARSFVEPIIGYGTARADQAASLTAEVSGEIVELADGLEVGRSVEKGELLIGIDDREYRNLLKLAEAKRAGVDADLDRLSVEEENFNRLLAIAQQEVRLNEEEKSRLADLFEREVAAKKEYRDARIQLHVSERLQQSLDNELSLIGPRRRILQSSRDGLQAEIETARLNVSRCSVAAPFSGVVDQKSIEVGERVQRGSMLLRIVDPRRIEIPIEIPVDWRYSVSVGAVVELTIDSDESVSWIGQVVRLSPVADDRNRMFAAFVEVDNRAQQLPLLPGMFVRAQIEGRELENVTLIPRNAIYGGIVYVVEGDRARLREVTIRRSYRDLALVEGQIHSGDRVITTNLDLLTDGATVEVTGGPDAAQHVEQFAETAESGRREAARVDDVVTTFGGIPPQEARP
jgi:multidrug efflux pump subunit AcrA (membrane-fusion protein)